ncbi:hypothetical protein DLD77_04605 [Chitinophaga alhagiae]|uniref:SGNH hydrolase-type esterase domain-containing protein n=1 Tax=Chitinophaga alhagiae TaxID=2203219 RepID=A0ABN5LNQ3_9BACT|nr:hypothetical protein [Chitinophaga alhagiae]AWO01027.1 hypothetical protein DLD77_04605 [Chitinophaga alhagiae]
MPSGNKHPYPFLITLGTLGCLGLLSFFNNSFSIAGHTLRPLDVLADLRPVEAAAPADSVAVAAVPDSAVSPLERPVDYTSYTGILDYGYNTGRQGTGMKGFIDALRALRAGHRKKVRIAYFGDSMIEGDLITQDLRDSLQANFGGKGVGYVPATSVVSGFRTTIAHSFSGDWMDYHFKNTPPAGTELGISGHVFVPAPQSWVRYQPVRRKRLNEFNEVSLLYGRGRGDVSINARHIKLQGQARINAYTFVTDSTERAVTLRFNSEVAAPFYGACFESSNGVFLDNYSFRGISGIELGKLSRRMWKDMQAVRPYDLIVLHYGANVLFLPENTRFDWYEKPMVKVVDSLRRLFPETSILIVGTADKAYKKKGKYITAPGVKALMKIQHNFAESRGMAYWNLFSAMGGEGAMARWVEGDTALANRDYTHFNFRGASRIGALLYKAIMDEYEEGQL